MKNSLNISPRRGTVRTWIVGGFFFLIFLSPAYSFWKKGCKAKLREILAPIKNSKYDKKNNPVNHRALEDQSRLARTQVDLDPNLRVPRGLSELRSPEQVEASLLNIMNKIRNIKSGTDEPLKIEEFLGLIDGNMGRHGARLADLFKALGVTKVSLLSKDKFAYHVENNSKTKKDEIVLDLANFPTDKPESAALWVKDLNLTLHSAAMRLLKNRQETLSKSEYKNEYREIWHKKIRDMEAGMSISLRELNQYMRKKFPLNENPLSLATRSMPAAGWYHAASVTRLTDVFMGGTLGATVGQYIHPTLGAPLGSLAGAVSGIVSGYFVKLQAPIGSWRLSLNSIQSKEAINIEREKLRMRTSQYYYYRYLNTGYANYVRIAALLAIGYTMHSIISHGGIATSSNEGLDEESKNVEELQKLSDAQLLSMGRDRLEEKYRQMLIQEQGLQSRVNQLNAQGKRKEADKVADLLAQGNKQMDRLLVQMSALTPDGIEE